jgi:hypothetical protein
LLQSSQPLDWPSEVHSLGNYGEYELAMDKHDYDDGVLGRFLLFLLPQADPRLPLPTSAGSQGNGKSGSGS